MKKNKLVSAPNLKNILGGKGVGREGQGALGIPKGFSSFLN